MNNNIDLTKILKDCPKGTKFYSYIFGDETYFQGLSLYGDKPISIVIYGKKEEWNNVSLLCKGYPYNDECGECCIFPSREMRDWSKFTAPWYKKEKFDPKTLKPFDRVLVRDSCKDIWRCTFYSHTREDESILKYITIDSSYKYCIPYNNNTKHLVGTRKEGPEYYKYWED